MNNNPVDKRPLRRPIEMEAQAADEENWICGEIVSTIDSQQRRKIII